MKTTPFFFPIVLCAFAFTAVRGHAQTRLNLTADTTHAAVGETITLTLSVEDAPAFAVWGASIASPTNVTFSSGPSTGNALEFVPDSRAQRIPDVRFGGYALTNHAAGSYMLGQIAVQAHAPGVYTLRAPAYAPETPFGAILLPMGEEPVWPLADDITLNISAADLSLTGMQLRTNTLELSWHGVTSGQTLYLEYATNLMATPVNWATCVTIAPPAPSAIHYQPTNHAPIAYYRIRTVE